MIKSKSEKSLQILVAMIYVTILLAATVCSHRLVKLGPFSETGSSIIYTFSFFWANVYTESYGLNESKKLIIYSVIAGYFFAISIALIHSMPAPDYWHFKNAFDIVVGHILRYTNGGTISFLLSMFLNAYLFSKWKMKLKGKFFWVRSIFAAMVSESFPTFICIFVSYYGIYPWQKVFILSSNVLFLQVLYGAIAVWPASFFSFLLKKYENHCPVVSSKLVMD